MTKLNLKNKKKSELRTYDMWWSHAQRAWFFIKTGLLILCA